MTQSQNSRKDSKANANSAGSDFSEKPKLCLITLGCKANQYDAYALLGYLAKKFVLVAPSEETPADIYLINTCTVTHRADFEARQWIRRAKKINPKAKVILAGCLASNLAGLKDAQFHQSFNALEREKLLEELAGIKSEVQNNIFYHPEGGIQFRSRALVKVQDGCNYRCSYCIVPYTRGKSRSLPSELVLSQIRALSEQGFQEMVLCGINLGEWGKDLGLELSDLLEKIAEAGLSIRLRLSSLEPMTISPRLIQTISESKFICPHLHLPLQSGDEEILKRMKRPYLASDFLKLTETLFAKIPNLALGLDVITGFPGETETHFENTLKLLEQIPFAYLHIFTFSPRANTPAAKFKPRVPEKISQARAQRLAQLNQARKQEYVSKQLGRILEVVVEERDEEWAFGHSENYLYLRVQSLARQKQRVRVRVKQIQNQELWAEELKA